MANFNSIYEIVAADIRPTFPYTLYHYSPIRVEQLMTLEQQIQHFGPLNPRKEKYKQDRDEKAIKAGYPLYSKHVSAFLDKIPIGLMLKNFPRHHKVWRRGNVLYEYQFDYRSLGDTPYKVVESPVDIFLLNFWLDNETYKTFFYQVRRFLKPLFKNAGDNQEQLAATVKKYKGGTYQAYVKLFNSEAWKDPKEQTKYASHVPHLMLYPTKPITPAYVRRIQL